MHAYTHAFIHAHMRKCMHPYIHVCIQMYIHVVVSALHPSSTLLPRSYLGLILLWSNMQSAICNMYLDLQARVLCCVVLCYLGISRARTVRQSPPTSKSGCRLTRNVDMVFSRYHFISLMQANCFTLSPPHSHANHLHVCSRQLYNYRIVVSLN